MNIAIPFVDITHYPELLHIAEEVERTQKPRELKRDNRTMAIIMPADHANKQDVLSRKRTPSQSDYTAFKAAAGSWKGLLDAEKFKADVYASRQISTRSPVQL